MIIDINNTKIIRVIGEMLEMGAKLEWVEGNVCMCETRKSDTWRIRWDAKELVLNALLCLFKKWIAQGMFEYWWQWSSRVGTFNIQEKQEIKILGKDPEYKRENWPLKRGNAFSVLKNRRIN